MLVNRKNIKRYHSRPKWMDGIPDTEQDTEHMEEIEHMDPPISEEPYNVAIPETKSNEIPEPQLGSQDFVPCNFDSQDISQPVPGSATQDEQSAPDRSTVAQLDQEPDDSGIETRYKKWKVGDKVEVLI